MSSIPHVATALQTVLTDVATTAARTTGLIQRQRAMSGAQFVQTLVFGWLAHPAATYDDLVAMAADLGVTITGPSLCAWFSEQSVDCLAQVLAAAMAQVVAADPVAIPLLARFPAVFLQDSTVISLPTELAEVFVGCGGSQGATAALKAHLRLEVRTGRVEGPLVQAGRASDRAVAFRDRPPVGSLTIRDLGSFQLDAMRHDHRDGRHWLSRLKVQTAVFLPDGTRVALFDWLDTQGTPTVEVDVQIGVAQRIPVRLLAVRVPQEVADQRRRRLQQDARKKGRTVRAETLAACAWTVVVTTVPADQLRVTEALVLLKLRWQIEIVFSQVTKSNVGARFGGRDDVADFHLLVGDDHTVDEQLNQLAPLREGSLLQAHLEPCAERRNRRDDLAHLEQLLGVVGELVGLTLEIVPLQDQLPLAPLKLRQLHGFGQIGRQ